ncbi:MULTISPECIES: tripartite tricarboxylate transporter substrate binding protein [unclassified Achromobacter]|uniref:Bug family tripartite tricarboxylate transporter substrate binding protein n=1 Tax=unclassified Achromobacter TaxID=2626865 RepID=UPI000B51D5C3|nr:MULTISPECIES: tripartite tricarboxylate transporter substrate binding protein [unclassified Achromobacter]OWT77081.1 Tat pathway signal protein [Achromobacter sp. HZ28]OWT77962.1 Tat pathway signal protein [Achromobacter sp. HZ34]
MPSPSLPRRALIVAAAASAVLIGSAASAQDYPSRPVTIIVPFSAGGGVDVMARLLAEKLRVTLKQNVIVENKPGASGMLGAGYVVKAPPDGYTLLLGSAGETAINPYAYKDKMAYSPEKDLAPVSLVSRVPNVLVAGPSLKANTTAELLQYAKAHPGKVSYASSGIGNPQHLNGALMESTAGVTMMHVPYKGASGQLSDVTGGNVDMTFVSYAAALPFIQSHKVRALGVTSAKRAAFAKDTPALAETPGLESYDLSNWFGVFAPAKTPAPVVTALNQAISAALRDPELAQRLTEQGGEVEVMTPQAFHDFILAQSKQYQAIVEHAHITAE